MRVEINGESRETAAATLAALLIEQGWPATGIATALNGAFVPAPERAEMPILPGDRVEVLAPMQGG